MDFRTLVDLPRNLPRLSLDSRVLLVGSCFVEHIGNRMTECLPEGHVIVNPMGVLYNPESIRLTLEGLMADEMPWTDKSFTGRDGLWHNWMSSTRFAANSRAELEQNLRQQWGEAARMLREKAPCVITTWSTDTVYRYNGDVVANCHKESGSCFSQETLDFDAMRHSWQTMTARLRQLGSPLLLTLSPYRYLRGGLTASGASKARLRHAMDELCREFPGEAHYFPAYEIMLDELRDYRFYDRDMLHPSEQAIDFIWERFVENAFTPELRCFAKEKSLLLRDLHHRPLHPDTEATRQFLRRCEERKAEFICRWGMW